MRHGNKRNRPWRAVSGSIGVLRFFEEVPGQCLFYREVMGSLCFERPAYVVGNIDGGVGVVL